MADHQKPNSKIGLVAGAPRSTNAAHKVVAAVLRDFVQNLDPTILKKLHTAVLSPFPETAGITIRELMASGTRAADLADFYIPAVARNLGEQWCVDELGFARVTIGSSRLQAMLRALGPNWSGENTDDPMAASILLVVPQDVYHTLGALVLAGQLRRKGLSVKLVLGGKLQDIATYVKRTKYDAVFISSSRGEALESLRRIVNAVKSVDHGETPIVVGGTILDVETAENIAALTGANFATANLDEALRLCSLQIAPLNDAQIKSRT